MSSQEPGVTSRESGKKHKIQRIFAWPKQRYKVGLQKYFMSTYKDLMAKNDEVGKLINYMINNPEKFM
jgi:hypothetical protein